jgi:uncharacterized protein YecE (DUF72 family)
MSVNPSIRVGVGGWTFEPWRGSFYDKGLAHSRELAFASRRLTTIEVNGTFYRSQSPETFRKWRDETPDGFVFALKAPRYATNRRNLAEAGESISRFTEGGLAELGDRLGPINWQFAGTKRFDPEEFEAFLRLLPEAAGSHPLRHAVEVRHESFRDERFVDLCAARGVAIVTAADSEYPLIGDQTADFSYLRIMGTAADEPLGYPDERIAYWADTARALSKGKVPADLTPVRPAGKAAARDVFLYVISGAKEKNPQAAMALIDRLGRH